MKKSQLAAQFFAGKQIMVVGYLSTTAEIREKRDKTKPGALTWPAVTHYVVLHGIPVKVSERLPDNVTTVDGVNTQPFKPLAPVALFFTQFGRDKGYNLIATGKLESIEEDDVLPSPGGKAVSPLPKL